MCKRNSNFENFENTVKLIYTLCAMFEMMIWTTFIIASMVRISGVQISNKPKCAKQTAVSKTLKTLWISIWTPLILTMLAMVNVLQIIISNIAHSVYMRFTVFQSIPNCNLFCTFFLLRNFYSSDAHHANNGEHFSSPHFRHCTLWVDEIYSVFTRLEIAVSFLHLG